MTVLVFRCLILVSIEFKILILRFLFSIGCDHRVISDLDTQDSQIVPMSYFRLFVFLV